jgi:hypothetical protein
MIKIHLLAAAISAALTCSWASAQGAPAGDAAKGAQKNQMCTGCHGIEGWRTAFPEVYKVPMISGQHETYIVKALQAYKSGEVIGPRLDGVDDDFLCFAIPFGNYLDLGIVQFHPDPVRRLSHPALIAGTCDFAQNAPSHGLQQAPVNLAAPNPAALGAFGLAPIVAVPLIFSAFDDDSASP